MRLTLRTLLAYMDDILDPADQEDLARQVEASENATELIHRTRDATRRLRLGAPPVIGEGMELDPNYVAEYLDNTMSAEDMTEFQQICLDSDVHLAEVASCHHVLTMVLGEPAEIDADMRQRMYGVPGQMDELRQRRLDGPHRVASTADNAPQQKSDSGAVEPVTEVPDYLKAGESSVVGRLALAFAAALVLGFGAFILFGPGGMLRDDPQLAQNGEAAEQSVDDSTGGTVEDAGPNVAPPDALAPDEGSDTMAPDANDEAAAVGGAPPDFANSEDATDASALPELAAGDPELPATQPEDESPMVLPEVTPDAASDDAGGSAEEVSDAIGIEAATAGAGEAAAPDKRLAMNTIDRTDVVPDALPNSEDPDLVVDDEAATEVAPPDAAPMGTLVAVDQVLLRWDPEAGQWLRMPSRSSILAGEQLLSLPTYRPSLALVSGLRVEFSDGANMVLDLADGGDAIRLEAAYGRFLLHNTNMEPIEVHIVVGDETRQVILESTAVLGVDVDRPFVPGADVEESVGMFVAEFYAPEGKVTWATVGGPMPVDESSQWSWNDTAPQSLTDDVEWLNGQSLDFLLQNVSRDFERHFDTDRPARLQLLEMYESSKRREEKSLAAQCGTHVGQFVPLVQALADTQQQSNWDEHIAELRRAMSRSTQTATLVHDTLTEQRGAALADDLFAMLRGYSPEEIGTTRDEIGSGVTKQLIDWLEHDRLEYRVLAIHNLKQIYGGKTLGYNPVITEPSRQQRAVKLWRTRLTNNELVPTYLQ